MITFIIVVKEGNLPYRRTRSTEYQSVRDCFPKVVVVVVAVILTGTVIWLTSGIIIIVIIIIILVVVVTVKTHFQCLYVGETVEGFLYFHQQ